VANRRQGGKAIRCRLTYPARRRQAAVQPKQEGLRKVDILMNNAGVYAFEPVETVTEAESIASSTPTCSALCSRSRRR